MMDLEEERKQCEATSIFLKNALDDRQAKGPASAVYKLVDKQLRKRSDLKLTRRLFGAVATHVTQVVGGHHEDLIAALFTFDFIVKGGQGPGATPASEALADSVRDAFTACARTLVSANATLAAPCLRMLARSLQSVSYAAPAAAKGLAAAATVTVAAGSGGDELAAPSTPSTPKSPRSVEAEAEAEAQAEEGLLDKLVERVVCLIVSVVRLVPTAGPPLVAPLLTEHFPHRFRDERCVRCGALEIIDAAEDALGGRGAGIGPCAIPRALLRRNRPAPRAWVYIAGSHHGS